MDRVNSLGGPMEIAVGGPADRSDLLDLLQAQLVEHRIEISDERLGAAIDGALLHRDRGMFLLARVDGIAVGVAYVSFQWALEHGGRCGWLEELYLVPSLRGRGVGERLLTEAIERARDAGCAAVDLEVEEDHRRAEHLYERHGFRPHRRRRWVKVL